MALVINQEIGKNMKLATDGDGFLIDRTDWTAEVMLELAKQSEIEITDDVQVLVTQVRQMYEDDGVVPALRVFSKATGGDRKGTHLNQIFDGGPMKKLAKIAGLPKPTGCV